MSTFHLFPHLPIELRIRIWNSTAFPHMVHVKRRWVSRYGEFGLQYTATSTPCPPVVQVCQESRRHEPYQRAFTTGAEPRYIWVNFETDMICNDDSHNALKLAPHEQDVQRLRFSIDDELAYKYLSICGDQEFKNFANIKEIYIAVDREIAGFSVDLLADTVNRCFNEQDDKVKLIDVGSGYMMNANQVRILSDWRNYYSFDTYGKANVNTFEEDMRRIQDLGSILTLSEMHALDDEMPSLKRTNSI
ncbi:hypothetical protein N5P37_009403 [Trichoderma harzianum]|uniref:2EXR domain-containing protein n=1 Tax=Trichoderma harzianum CBS 226.95 TaxID=983964 RepID=A0A2T4A7Z6_TRIHA|nr:hypothetical protein M431DRAFT_496505 [Trichoderma harzianum CBS 226.95]KAK0758105.1 hypothetical protein N5P37_009403 [Trichoderma harzianum]PKK42558.1 hypothetical protein CI102_13600 [Trichoderma harzianum]PTB53195.1 hypothetical protein M431DRAFT_496505 [Trichoderma harzianum CBS 226.95]